jgi:anaerobic selenocysteine-containing dehydrogenase
MSWVDNDRIRIRSAAGEIERNIRISRTIEPGYIHVPTAFNGNDARNLLKLAPLDETDSSGWDSCPVAVEKAETVTVDK